MCVCPFEALAEQGFSFCWGGGWHGWVLVFPESPSLPHVLGEPRPQAGELARKH